MPAGNVPPRPSEDIQSILNRFQSWTGKQQDKSRSNGHAEVREVPMEEAMEQMRQRRGRRATPAAATRESEPVQAELAPPQAKAEPAPKPVVPPIATAAPAVKMQPETPAKLAEPVKNKPARAAKKIAKPLEPVTKKAAKPPVASPAKKARKKPVLSAKPALPQRKASRARRKPAPATAAKPAFREVLTRSVQAEISTPRRSAEREQRISVRLSQQEEQRLQQAAAKAGTTVSEYLRRCALAGTPPNEASAPQSSAKTRPVTLFEPAPAKSSGLGDWLSLLRNRFLASPARIAERA